MISNILAVFDIGPPLDGSGKPQNIGEVVYTSGATRSVSIVTVLRFMLRIPLYQPSGAI